MTPVLRSLQSLNTKVIVFGTRKNAGVCDNLLKSTRKLLILKTERCPSG